MPLWWQEANGTTGIVFHDEVIISPDNHDLCHKSKWAHFKLKRNQPTSPAPQKISKKMFRFIHPSMTHNALLTCKAEMDSLPTASGCYAVIRGVNVIYVGASSNIRKRCKRFINKGDVVDRLYFWITRAPYQLESSLIAFLAPKNNCHLKHTKFPKLCSWSGKFREEIED